MILFGFRGAIPATCLMTQFYFLFTPLPNCVQIWFQPLLFDFGLGVFRWAHRCDPAWFF